MSALKIGDRVKVISIMREMHGSAGVVEQFAEQGRIAVRFSAASGAGSLGHYRQSELIHYPQVAVLKAGDTAMLTLASEPDDRGLASVQTSHGVWAIPVDCLRPAGAAAALKEALVEKAREQRRIGALPSRGAGQDLDYADAVVRTNQAAAALEAALDPKPADPVETLMKAAKKVGTLAGSRGMDQRDAPDQEFGGALADMWNAIAAMPGEAE